MKKLIIILFVLLPFSASAQFSFWGLKFGLSQKEVKKHLKGDGSITSLDGAICADMGIKYRNYVDIDNSSQGIYDIKSYRLKEPKTFMTYPISFASGWFSNKELQRFIIFISQIGNKRDMRYVTYSDYLSVVDIYREKYGEPLDVKTTIGYMKQASNSDSQYTVGSKEWSYLYAWRVEKGGEWCTITISYHAQIDPFQREGSVNFLSFNWYKNPNLYPTLISISYNSDKWSDYAKTARKGIMEDI